MNGITLHCKRIAKTNYISSSIALFVTIVVLSAIITLTLLYSTAGWLLNSLLFAVLFIGTIIIWRRIRFFEKTVFDDIGVSFYKFGRLVSSFEWNEVESATVIKSHPITIKGMEYQIPFLALTTPTHRTVPNINSNGKAYNIGENGRPMKMNSDKSSLAFVFGIGTANESVCLTYLKTKRPEFFKKKEINLKNIGYD